jgi:serine/threonine-protein kinase
VPAHSLALSPDVLALQGAVAGRYVVERELGRGGMGLVLLARDLALDRPLAIKLLPAALAADPAMRERFLREARISAGLSHPHVVPIYAVEEHPAVVFFAMAYVEGETLAGRVRRAGPLPAPEAARLLREVAWALAYAHGRGVVHRDVKPENVMIERGSGRALVSDFGIAQSVAAPSPLTREGEILGSVAFMSPEQAAGEPVDGRSDLYALGGVGFYLLTGRPPFEAASAAALLVQRLTTAAPPVASVRADVPPRLAAVIDRCLARAPEARFASAEAVAEALAAATRTTGAADIAPAVRSFVRAAEQTMWLVWLIAIFTLLYGLPAVERLGPLLVGITLGTAIVSVDLVRRARELFAEGYGAGDVQRAFVLERRAHEEELRALFDPRRTAAYRRTRRRAWALIAAALLVKAATFLPALHPRPGTRYFGLWLLVNVLMDLTAAVTLVIAVNASPRAERRFFRITARLWEGRFGPGFFRVATVGRGPRPHVSGGPLADATADAMPPAVASRFPDLPALLRRLEEAFAALGAHETRVARALAAAGLSGDGAAAVVAGEESGTASAASPRAVPTTAILVGRRDALLADMHRALEGARARRTALAAARENIRVQLLRIGAGVGGPADLDADVADARALLDVQSESGEAGSLRGSVG